MKTWMSLNLFITAMILGQPALAQVGAEGPADEQKVESAISSTECAGFLDNFKRRVISYNSDTQNDAEVTAQVFALMQDAESQAKTMNCAQNINMAVETVDVSTSYRARLRRRMVMIQQAILAKVNSNTFQNLRMREPAATIGVRG